MRPYDTDLPSSDSEPIESFATGAPGDGAQDSVTPYEHAVGQSYADVSPSQAALQDVDYNYNSSLDMADPAWPNQETSPATPVTPAGTIGSIPPEPTSDSSNADADMLGTSSTTAYRAKVMPAGAIDVTPTGTQPGSRKADDDANGGDTVDAGDDTGDTEAIRADIEHTRSHMSTTIDAIQERLNPQNLVDQAKGAVREATIGRVENMVTDVRNTAQEAGNGLLETIKENPVPAALAAIGIGWLFMKSRNNTQNKYRYGGYYNYDDYGRYGLSDRYSNGDRYSYGPTGRYDNRYGDGSAGGYNDRPGGPGEMIGNAQDKVGDATRQVGRKVGDAASQVGSTIGDAAGQVRDTVGNAAGSVGDAAGGLVDNVQDKAGDLGSGLQYNAQRAQNSLQRMLYENPLAVGAAALVAGAAIGMMLPETQPEHRLMGEAKDNMMEKAQVVAQDTMDKVSRVAEQVTTTAQQEAQNQGLTS